MDMSFAYVDAQRPARKAARLADILADADHRRIEATRSFGGLAAILRGQEGQDPVLALAQVTAAGVCGQIETARLAGSFNPLVARQLMVGKAW